MKIESISCKSFPTFQDTWSNASNMAYTRLDHTASVLPNGKVLVAGGLSYGGCIKNAELYDPSTGL